MKRELEFNASRTPFDPGLADEDVAPQLNYAELVIRYRWWLTAGALIGLLLGNILYLKLGPEYAAVGEVMVSRRNGLPLKEERTLGDWGERSDQVRLVSSPLILQAAVEAGRLDELPTLQGESDLPEVIKESLSVKRTAGQDRSYLNVFDITYSSPQAADARRVVQAVIDAYSRYLDETRDENTSQVLASARRSFGELQQTLTELEARYTAFRQTAPLQWRSMAGAAGPGGQGATTNVHQERVLAIETQRQQNLIKQAEIQSRKRAIQQLLSNGEPRESLESLVRLFLKTDGPNGDEGQRQQELTVFDSRILPLMIRKSELERDFGPDYPELQSVKAAIREALDFYRQLGLRLPDDTTPDRSGRSVRPRSQVDFVDLYIETLKQQETELGLREQQLSKMFEEESNKAKELAVFQDREQSMNAELTRQRATLSSLADRINQLQVDKDNSGYRLKQIAPIREELVIKRMLKFLASGMFLGLVLVAAVAAIRELQDTRVKTVEQIRRLATLPLLGTVAAFRSAATNLVSHPALRFLAAPTSVEAENYRSIRAALSVVTDLHSAKVLQITSSEPGDGKTTTAANIALAFAQTGHRVLLVDADLRRPTVHKLFGVAQERGLSELIAGEISLPEALRPTTVPSLSLITAGSAPLNPSELVASERFGALVEEFRGQYDYVLIDTPPMLAVSDPCIISKYSDGVLLVVRINKNRRAVLRRAIDLGNSHNARWLGVVVNGLSLRGSDGYGYYYYYEYTGMTPGQPAASSSGGSSTPARELVRS